MKQIRKRLTYANVMSSIAVFLVVGGATAFAAGHLGKNTVGAKQLKKNAVATAKIKKEAVTGAKIKKGTITGTNLNLAQLGTVPSATNASHATSADSANNAKLLDGIGSTAFSREASSAINNEALEKGEEGVAREVNINAPQNGFLFAVGSSDVFGSGTSEFYECEFFLDNHEQRQTVRESEISAPTNSEENCDTNAIFPVSAGTHNVKFNFSDIGPNTIVDETELDVVFIPFAG